VTVYEKLSSWIETHRHDKNYQHKDLPEDQFLNRAKSAFKRLSTEQQNNVFELGKKWDLDIDILVRARFLAQTNLFALCKLLEKYEDMTDAEYVWVDGTVHNTHEEICNSFFVRKDPTVETFKKFAVDYIEKKQRLLLVPRGGFKSSMNMADCVQWIINWAEVTILVLTGVLELANDFVKEIKSHFELEDTGKENFAGKKGFKPRTMASGLPSIFQILFPEHCIAPDTGKANEYQTPACKVVDKECTVFAASIEQNLVGWHVGVMKLDDVVTNENSQTADRIKNVNKQVSINQAMLHPFGFYDKIGTWYDSEDTYGQDITNSKKYAEEGLDFPMLIYIRAAWWPNEEAQKQGKIPEEMTKSDYGLWFNVDGNPHSLTYEFLLGKKKTDQYFAIKYLNDPTQMNVIRFPRELLVRRTHSAMEIPSTGMIVTCVDTAYTTNAWSDYSAIATALIYGGCFHMIDLSRGRYNEYELPQIIAATVLKWKPAHVCIEESGAIKYIQREVYREMDKLKVRVPVTLVPLGQGTKKNSKKMKAGPLLRFLGDDRFRFSTMCPNLDVLYDELSKFGTAASTHDDIVDALALMVNQFSGYADMEGKALAASTDYVPNLQEKAHYDMIYGVGQYDKFNAHNLAMEFPSVSPEQIQQATLDVAQANNDPLADLF
jgi:phage terminase large subunit-like protein